MVYPLYNQGSTQLRYQGLGLSYHFHTLFFLLVMRNQPNTPYTVPLPTKTAYATASIPVKWGHPLCWQRMAWQRIFVHCKGPRVPTLFPMV